MSETVVDPGKLSDRDQQALEAAQGMGLKGLGQPANNLTPAPAAPVDKTQPSPQPGTGTAPVANTGANPIEVKSALGAKVFGAPAGPVLSSFADVQAYAKEHGLELNTPDEIRGVIDTVNVLKEKAEQAEQLASMVAQYKSQFGSLPPDVANIVDAAINGKDYKSVIRDVSAGVAFDLSRKFEEHSVVSLIRQYAQPGITQEAYEELTPANKDAITALAKAKYESEQVRWQQAVADQTSNKQRHEQAFSKSINDALTNLKKQFPTMDNATLKAVHDKMAYGLKDSLFNPDNTYKPDAAIKVAMQEYGLETLEESYKTIGQLAEKMRSRIQGETQEQLLLRSDKPDQQGRQVADNSNIIAEAVAKELAFTKVRG